MSSNFDSSFPDDDEIFLEESDIQNQEKHENSANENNHPLQDSDNLENENLDFLDDDFDIPEDIGNSLEAQSTNDFISKAEKNPENYDNFINTDSVQFTGKIQNDARS